MRSTTAAPDLTAKETEIHHDGGTSPAVARRTVLEDLALCLSWANLCYLRVWSELLTYTESDRFTMAVEPSRPHYLAALAGMMGLGLAAWILVSLARRFPSPVRRMLRWVPVAAMLIPLNALRVVVSDQVPWLYGYLRQPAVGRLGIFGLVLAAGLLAVGGLALLWRFRHAAPRAPAVTALVLLPLLPVTAGQALWRAARGAAGAMPEARLWPRDGARAQPQAGMRLALVIFDEWDYRLSFEARPAGLQLPELDRWRGKSLFATQALPPADQTMASIGSLLTGIRVTRVDPISRRDAFLLPVGGGEPVQWARAPSLFQDAAEAGLRAGIAGWAVPYCRLYSAHVDQCVWWETSIRQISKGSAFGDILTSQLRSLVETAVFSPFGQSAVARHHYQTWRAMLQATARLVGDPSLSVVFIHLPVPHSPYVYDRRRGRFDRANSLAEGYVDQLALVDDSVRELRHALEHSGLWDRTAVLLTSDHSFRSAPALGVARDPRVPFVLRLPGAASALEYARAFNTIVTRELAGAILRGEVADAAQAALWLDRASGERNVSQQRSAAP